MKLSELVTELENNEIPYNEWKESSNGYFEFMQTDRSCSGGIFQTYRYIHIKTDKGTESLFWLGKIKDCVETSARDLERIGFEDDLTVFGKIKNSEGGFWGGTNIPKIDDIVIEEQTQPLIKLMEVKCLNSNCGYEMAIAHSDSVIPYNNNVYKCPCCGSAMSQPFDYSKEEQESEIKPKLEPYKESGTPHDVVNNPSHYKRGEIECYEALKASMTKEQFLGHLKATTIAYLWRYDLKNGLEDVKKAKWYVDKMVEEMESEK